MITVIIVISVIIQHRIIKILWFIIINILTIIIIIVNIIPIIHNLTLYSQPSIIFSVQINKVPSILFLEYLQKLNPWLLITKNTGQSKRHIISSNKLMLQYFLQCNSIFRSLN